MIASGPARPSKGSGLSLAGVRILIAVGGLLAASAPTRAQDLDCNRLQAAIQRLNPQGGGPGDSPYARAAQRQQAEIDRTRSYAESIGCDGQQFGLFGGEPPPQCSVIESRIQRMQANLAQLSERSQQDQGEGGDRTDLIARYNAACRGNPANLSQDSATAFVDPSGRNPNDLRTDPNDPDALSTVPLNGDISGSPPARGAGRAICVRTCDGGYFPLTPRASEDQLAGLESLCKASCPNTEARLYTMTKDEDLAAATAIDGTPYLSLPDAFKFEKTFTASCTCKPPDQSWGQALGEAEKLLDEHRGDVTVTAKMSEDLAKPKATALPAAKGRGKGQKPAPVVAAPPDPGFATEGLRGSQAPTASNASAGIGASAGEPAAVVKSGAGPVREVKGPDGVRKTVRIIAP